MTNFTKRMLATLVGLSVGTALAFTTISWRNTFNQQESDMKVNACVKGFKYASIHYKVYNKMSVDQIKKDAAFECQSWKLQ